jgi:hypothetical protein
MYIEFSPWDESIEVIYPQTFDKISRIFTEKSRHNIEIIDMRHPEKYWDNSLRQARKKSAIIDREEPDIKPRILNVKWPKKKKTFHRESPDKIPRQLAVSRTKYLDNRETLDSIEIPVRETLDSSEIPVRETPEIVTRIFTIRRLKKCRKFSLISPIKYPEYPLWNGR